MAFAHAVLGTCCSRSVVRLLLAIIMAAAPLRSLAGPGGDGHTHGDEAAPMVSAVSPRVSMPGELYDVVAIYKNAHVIFFVDRLGDNAPVTDAVLDVTTGPKQVQLKSSPEGTYVMQADEFAGGGSHELIVSIQAPGGDDLVGGTLDLASLVPANSGHGHLDEGFLSFLVSPWAGLTSISGTAVLVLFGGGLLIGVLSGALIARRLFNAAAAVALMVVASALPALAGPGGDGHTHGDEAAVRLSSDAPHRLPDGSVFVPKPTQRLLEVRTQSVEIGEVRRAISLPGRVIASPHQSGIVQSINGGRVSIATDRLPTLGHR
jgi:cobalt-zinc-cadmium efflux system membrane fusion protein